MGLLGPPFDFGHPQAVAAGGGVRIFDAPSGERGGGGSEGVEPVRFFLDVRGAISQYLIYHLCYKTREARITDLQLQAIIINLFH